MQTDPSLPPINDTASNVTSYCLPMRKKIGYRELTMTKMVTASSDWAVTWAVIELWPSTDWAVIILKMLWLSCDLTVTELWPSRDWAVTSPWPLLAVTELWSLVPELWPLWSPWSHGDNFFLMGMLLQMKKLSKKLHDKGSVLRIHMNGDISVEKSSNMESYQGTDYPAISGILEPPLALLALGPVSLTAFPSQFNFDGNFVSLPYRC